jgi:hypothetical protein
MQNQEQETSFDLINVDNSACSEVEKDNTGRLSWSF